MVAKINQKKLKNNDVISASEIGQYYFCSKAWYLQKCGYNPDSPFLEIGKKKHEILGDIIDETQNKTKKYDILTIIGYLIMIFAVLILLFKVIL